MSEAKCRLERFGFGPLWAGFRRLSRRKRR
jgi:hypothetical protein